jgi:phosphoglycolate phosphatase-like HAD superfamily hydrolase
MICLFDMDGTLFDYEGAIRRDLKLIASPEESIDYDHPAFGAYSLLLSNGGITPRSRFLCNATI